MLAHLKVCSGDVVLDAGSGPGAYLAKLTAGGARVAMQDTSRGMLHAGLNQISGDVAVVSAVNVHLQSPPFASGSFERVMANHVLYHLPDIRVALEELRCVLRRGGRIVLATNARFSLDELPLVQSVFPAALVRRRADAFVFPTVADVLAYCASGPVDWIADPPLDAGHREPLMDRVGAAIQAIIEREGVFRAPKTSGCFVADV